MISIPEVQIQLTNRRSMGGFCMIFRASIPLPGSW